MAALVLSLGPHVRIWGTVVTTHGPYAWLLAIVPGMDGMRVPARFAIIVIAALSVLVAFGVDWLLRRAAPRFRPWIAVACVAMVVADGWAVPIITVSTARAAVRRIAASRSGWRTAPPGALLHLPIQPAASSCSTISS